MTVPLSRFLSSFSEPSAIPLAMQLPVDAPEIRMTPEALDARLTMARHDVEARYERQIADLQAAHEQALVETLDAARATWCETEGPALTARLDEAVSALKIELSHDIAAALTPLLSGAIVARAKAALLDIIDIVLKDGKPLSLCGRADLLDAIRGARPDAHCIEFIPSDAADVILNTDECRIETRLGLALAALDPTEA